MFDIKGIVKAIECCHHANPIRFVDGGASLVCCGILSSTETRKIAKRMEDVHKPRSSKLSVLVFTELESNSPWILGQSAEVDLFLEAGGRIVVFRRSAGDSLDCSYPASSVDVVLLGDHMSFAQSMSAYLQGAPDDFEFVGYMSSSAEFSFGLVEEMASVLDAAEKHAFVSPRLNDASFASLPANNEVSLNVDQQVEAVHLATDLLPQYSCVPYARPACFLAKRSVVDNLGFLADGYESLDGALADACLHANLFGFNALIANHVFLRGSIKNGSMPQIDRQKIVEGYPFVIEAEDAYLSTGIDPCDKFLDLMIPGAYEKPKLLFEFSNMFDHYCGTSEYQNALLKYFYELYSDVFELHIHVNKAASDFFHLEEKYDNIHFVGILQGTYHIGLCANQPIDVDQECYLNRYCLKTVYTMLDIILCRTYYLKVGKWQRDDIMRLGMSTSDGLISISDFSKNDSLAYFADDAEIQKRSMETISIATDFGDDVQKTEHHDLPFEKYYLIAGNFLKHKALREAADALGESTKSFIAMGIPETGYLQDNVYSYEGSYLSEEFLDYLYAHCEAVVFPSLYEGYGLPIAIGLKHDKRVIVNDNQVNRELYKQYPDLHDHFVFFKRLSDLPQIINRVDDLPALSPGIYGYSWKDAIIGIESYLQKVLLFPLDEEKLRRRWHMLNLIQVHVNEVIGLVEEDMRLKTRLSRKFLDGHPTRYAAARKLYHGYLKCTSGSKGDKDDER